MTRFRRRGQHLMHPIKRLIEDNAKHLLGAARAQLHKTYIVAETEDGLTIIDQHAAHERLVMERMKLALAEKGIASQTLLLPEVVFINHYASALVDAAQMLESRFVENFGAGAVVVRAIPALLGTPDVKQLMTDIAEELVELGVAPALKTGLIMFCNRVMPWFGASRSNLNGADECTFADMEATMIRAVQSWSPYVDSTIACRY